MVQQRRLSSEASIPRRTSATSVESQRMPPSIRRSSTTLGARREVDLFSKIKRESQQPPSRNRVIKVIENVQYNVRADTRIHTVAIPPNVRTLRAVYGMVSRILGWTSIPGKEVAQLFTSNGRKVEHLEDLKDGELYAASSGNAFCALPPEVAAKLKEESGDTTPTPPPPSSFPQGQGRTTRRSVSPLQCPPKVVGVALNGTNLDDMHAVVVPAGTTKLCAVLHMVARATGKDITRLFTMKGEEITDIEGLEGKDEVVASCGEDFIEKEVSSPTHAGRWISAILPSRFTKPRFIHVVQNGARASCVTGQPRVESLHVSSLATMKEVNVSVAAALDMPTVTALYTMQGERITSVDDMSNGMVVVASDGGDFVKPLAFSPGTPLVTSAKLAGVSGEEKTEELCDDKEASSGSETHKHSSSSLPRLSKIADSPLPSPLPSAIRR